MQRRSWGRGFTQMTAEFAKRRNAWGRRRRSALFMCLKEKWSFQAAGEGLQCSRTAVLRFCPQGTTHTVRALVTSRARGDREAL